MTRLLGLASLTALAISAATAGGAQDVVEKKPDSVTVQAKGRDRMVCRTERVTGSMVQVQRSCATQRDWDKVTDRTQQDLDRFDRQFQERATSTSQSSGLPLGACGGPIC